MERQVEMAVQQALSLARARGGELAAVNLRADDPSGVIAETARKVLKRLGREVDVHVEMGELGVELVSIELERPPRR
jgi:hypothetical protein